VGRSGDFHLAEPLAARILAGLHQFGRLDAERCEDPGWLLQWKEHGDGAHERASGSFQPVVRLDLGYTTDGVTKGTLYQIDGGRWVNDHRFDLVRRVECEVTTVACVRRQGRAPDVLETSRDRRVDVTTRLRPGYHGLSKPKRSSDLRTYSQSLTPGNSDLAVLYDKDERHARGRCPAGSGGVTPIPR